MQIKEQRIIEYQKKYKALFNKDISRENVVIHLKVLAPLIKLTYKPIHKLSNDFGNKEI